MKWSLHLFVSRNLYAEVGPAIKKSKNNLIRDGFFPMLFCLSLCVFSEGCNKNDFVRFPQTNSSFVDSAFNYLQRNLSSSELSAFDVNNYWKLSFEGSDKFLMIHQKVNNGKSVLVEKDGGSFVIYRLDLQLTQERSGSLSTELVGQFKKSTFYFVEGQVTKIERTKNGITKTSVVRRRNNNLVFAQNSVVKEYEQDLLGVAWDEIGGVYQTLPEVVFSVRTGTGYIDLYSLYYYTNQNPNYYYSYSEVGGAPKNSGGGNGGGGHSSDVINVPVARAATKPVSILAELKCFTNVPGAVYSLKINVNQPKPSSRTVLDVLAEHPVGHCYLTLEQRNPNGSIVTRNVGWYPTRDTKPGENCRGAYQDDTNVPYTVSLSVSVSAGEFQNVKTYLTNASIYAIQGLNCTNIAVNAFEEANVHLPQTVGVLEMYTGVYTNQPNATALLYTGLNPGDMGEDIRELDVNAFSRANGGRKVVIVKSPSNSQRRTRTGLCQ